MEANERLRRRHRRQRIAAALIVVIGGAAVAGLILYNRRIAEELGTGTFVPKKERITPEVLLLQQYVQIDTSNPPGNETAGARWLAAELARRGIAAEVIESAPGRGSVYARIRGRRSGEGLLLLNHIDVVPADPKAWSVPPFSGAIRLNMLHGRGTLDMKGIALCQLEAFAAVARAGRPPEHDVVFLAVADEEAGAKFGMLWLLENRPDIFEGLRYVLTEGGTTEMQREQIRYFGIETGSKQLSIVEVAGPSIEALREARLALEPHFFPRDPHRVLPSVRRYFRAVAPGRVENRDLYLDIDRALANGKFWLLPVAYRELLQNNVVAEGPRNTDRGARMTVHLINLPDQDADARIEWLRGFLESYGASIAEVVQKEDAVPVSPEETPLFAIITSEVRRQHSGVPVGPQVLARATNDCRFLRRRGMVCYGLQPFPVDFFQSLSIHGVDERVRLDWFRQGVELMRRIVERYANGQ